MSFSVRAPTVLGEMLAVADKFIEEVVVPLSVPVCECERRRNREMNYKDVLQHQAGAGLPLGQYYPPGDPRRTQG